MPRAVCRDVKLTIPKVLSLVCLGAVLALLGFNLFSAQEPQIRHRIEHRYPVSDPQFSRSMGVLLGPALLAGNRVDTLLITGCSTSACVRATATDAKSNYLKPIIVREAVEDRSAVAHEWTLFDIQARFADVVSADEALKYLGGLK